nr:class I poly(R)-hydroxyalkanoic acid synthase [Roseospirillum parvum]
MQDIAARSQRLVSDFLARQAADPQVGMSDPLAIGSAFLDMTTQMMASPTKLMEAQLGLWQDYMTLWQTAARRMMGEDDVAPLAQPEKGDRRFKDEAWSENQVFDYIKQSYLLTARWMRHVVNDVEGLDPKTAAKVDFYTRQFVDALAPTNFVATNPEVLRETLESGGENLVKGLEHLLEDLERGKGQLRIQMTDDTAFEVGVNVAATEGKVIYRNELMELIQYSPRTEKVFERPLLVIPPWINKFYIMDLRPKNSLVRWLLDQGHTVFMISWINPDEKLAGKRFEDYMQEGPLTALDIVRKVTGQPTVNAIGYCLGGTLLGATMAYMAAKGDDRITSATHFVTMLDFVEPGDLGVFIDSQTLEMLDRKMAEVGYLDGSEMATTFNMLRANDLIWSFVVNNYLLGKDPFPFDLLYWNSDSTRMPAAMHSFYLHEFYEKNRLKDPGAITLEGVPIDLGKVKVPSYFISTLEDHIAPWRSTYRGVHLYSGPTRFVLSGSGHIAGIINPPNPDKPKYGYFLNSRKPKDPAAWLKGATKNEGSWWPDWQKWVSSFTGPLVEARQPGSKDFPPLEDAPGSYVRIRV